MIVERTLFGEDASIKPRDHVISCIVVTPYKHFLSDYRSYIGYGYHGDLIVLAGSLNLFLISRPIDPGLKARDYVKEELGFAVKLPKELEFLLLAYRTIIYTIRQASGIRLLNNSR
jgi:hypothetical protein